MFVSVLSLSVSADLCVQLSTYMLHVCVFVCVPTENPRTAVQYRPVSASTLRPLNFTHTLPAKNSHSFDFINGT